MYILKIFVTFFQLLSDFQAEFPDAEDFQKSWDIVAPKIFDKVRCTSSLTSVKEIKPIINAEPSSVVNVGVQTIKGCPRFFHLKLFYACNCFWNNPHFLQN